MQLAKFRIYYLIIATLNGVFSMALPLYYDTLNYTPLQVGLLISLPSFMMLLQPMWGVIVDKYKKPKIIAIIGLMTSSTILLSLAFVTNYYLVFLIILSYSFVRMPVWSTVDNIIVTYCMNNQKSYGTIRVFASIAWGSSLLIMFPIINIFGFRSYFIISFIGASILSLMIAKFPSNLTLDNDEHASLDFNAGIKVIKSQKEFHYIVIYTLFFSAMFATNLVYQNMYLQELGASAFLISLITFLGIVPEFVILPLIEKHLYKLRPVTWLMINTAIFLIRFLVIAFFPSIINIAIVATFHGIAMSVYIPVFIRLLKSTVPSSVSTTAITINSFMAAISGIIMSLLAGYLRGHFGISSIYFINAIAMVIALYVLYLYRRYLIKNKM